MDKRSVANIPWDQIGITLSGICAIHCLILPVLVALLPLVPLMGDYYKWLHPLFILLIIPVVFFAVRRSHYHRGILILLTAGTLFIIAGWGLGHLVFGLWVELGLTLSGSILLILGHWKNYRHHRECSSRHHNHHPVAEEILSSRPGEELNRD
jgi:hypothetical protein